MCGVVCGFILVVVYVCCGVCFYKVLCICGLVCCVVDVWCCVFCVGWCRFGVFCMFVMGLD